MLKNVVKLSLNSCLISDFLSKNTKLPKSMGAYFIIFFTIATDINSIMKSIRIKSLLFTQKEISVQLSKTTIQIFVVAWVSLLSVVFVLFFEYKVVQMLSIASVIGLLLCSVQLIFLVKKQRSIQQQIEKLQQNNLEQNLHQS